MMVFNQENSAVKSDQQAFVKLCCPLCKGKLNENQSRLVCTTCEKGYPIRDGIPIFAEQDDFYEGRYVTTYRSVPKRLRGKIFWGFMEAVGAWRTKQDAFLKRCTGAQGVILDLGCGGGREILAWNNPTVGVDLSLAAVRNALTIYVQAAQARADLLPFPDASFDYVVSAHLLGHIPFDVKSQVLSEIRRVLKPGGRTIHLIECGGGDDAVIPRTRLEAFVRAYPELYRKAIIEMDGHYGLEWPRKALARFEKLGLKCVAVEQMASTSLAPFSGYIRLFEQGYAERSQMARLVLNVARFAVRTKVFDIGWDIFMGLFCKIIENNFVPLDNASLVMVCYEKPV